MKKLLFYLSLNFLIYPYAISLDANNEIISNKSIENQNVQEINRGNNESFKEKLKRLRSKVVDLIEENKYTAAILGSVVIGVTISFLIPYYNRKNPKPILKFNTILPFDRGYEEEYKKRKITKKEYAQYVLALKEGNTSIEEREKQWKKIYAAILHRHEKTPSISPIKADMKQILDNIEEAGRVLDIDVNKLKEELDQECPIKEEGIKKTSSGPSLNDLD